MRKNYLLTIVTVFICAFSYAQISLQPFASGFTSPIDLKSAGDDRIFVVEQDGYIRIMDTLGNLYPGYFLDIESKVQSGGEMGLLGLAFDPDYATNRRFYVNYTNNNGDTRISRFVASASNPDSALSSTEIVLLTIYQPYTNHNGGHLAFGPDGYLYIGMGDGGSAGDPQNRAQNLDSLLGKMLRIDVNTLPAAYSIPATNPYVGVTGREEIWASGLRNPWRWSFDRFTGDLWIGDVGQNQYEEINFQPANSTGGENYGWRCYEADHTFNTSGCGSMGTYDFPVLEVNQNDGSCAIIGGYVYRGAEFSNLYGKYFFSDQCLQNIRYMDADNGTFNVTDLGDILGASTVNVSFGEDAWGEIYLVTYGGDIYKLEGQSCSPIAQISTEDTLTICGDSTILSTPMGRGFHYQWSINGNPFGNDSSSIMINQSANYQVIAIDRNGCRDTSSVVYIDFMDSIAVTMTGLDSVYCVDDSLVAMTGDPAGGTFSGPGVIGNNFHPTVAGVGTHTINYVYDNGMGCSDSTQLEVVVSICTGIRENEIESFQLFPNPNSGNFVYSFFSNSDQKIDLEIINVLGRTVHTDKAEVRTGVFEQSLNLSNLSTGVYLFRIKSGDHVFSHSFIVE